MKKIIVTALLMVLLIPVLLVMLLSFFSYYKYPQLLPTFFTINYWQHLLFANRLFWESLMNSMVIGALNAIAATIIGLMTGRALTRYAFRGKKILLLFFSLPLFIPSMALFIGIHMMMIRLSLINTYLGVVIAHMIISIPYATNISMSFFQGISRNMEDLARTLGCTNKNLFIKIMAPLMMPGILLSLSICFLLSFSEYFSVFLVGGGKIITLSMVMFPYISNSDYGNGAAISLVFMMVNLGVFFIADFVIRKKTKERHYLYD
ncbi:MAG: ABC transporter permease [Acetobacterium sp.]